MRLADPINARWRAGEIPARVIALILLLLAMLGVVWMMPFRTEVPAGCDDFGYMRQAELFRDKGLGGFDTQLTTPAAERLFAVMRDGGAPVHSWYQAVAPHCHHYREATDKVILQYPPGTGALMAALPPDKQERLLRIGSIVAMAAVFAIMIGTAPSALVASVTVAAAAGAMWAAGGNGSDSVPPASAAAALCGLLLAPSLERRNWLALFVLGLACGLGGSIRVTNLFFPAAIGLVLVVSLVVRRRPGELVALVVFAFGLLAGLLPLGWSNFVNAGSVFASTYSPIDATPPQLSVDGLLRGLAFYFNLNAPGLLLMGAVAAGLPAFAERPGSKPIAAAFLALLGSLAYLAPKDILIDYYLVPVSTFVLAATASWQGGRAPTARRVTAGVFAAVVIGLGVAFCLLRPFPPTKVPVTSTAVLDALAADPIVWADLSGGRFVQRYGVYSAKLNFTSAANQDLMVDGLASAGQLQLIVLDTDSMRRILERISDKHETQLLGQAFDADVYRIGPISGR